MSPWLLCPRTPTPRWAPQYVKGRVMGPHRRLIKLSSAGSSASVTGQAARGLLRNGQHLHQTLPAQKRADAAKTVLTVQATNLLRPEEHRPVWSANLVRLLLGFCRIKHLFLIWLKYSFVQTMLVILMQGAVREWWKVSSKPYPVLQSIIISKISSDTWKSTASSQKNTAFALLFLLFSQCAYCKSSHFKNRVDIFLTLLEDPIKEKISHLVWYWFRNSRCQDFGRIDCYFGPGGVIYLLLV